MIEEMKIFLKDQEHISNDENADRFMVQTDENFENADMLGTL